jgi:hypothetical protein
LDGDLPNWCGKNFDLGWWFGKSQI